MPSGPVCAAGRGGRVGAGGAGTDPRGACRPSSSPGLSPQGGACLTAHRSPPSDLALASKSPDSLQVSWTPPSGHVLHYRLTYAPASGSGPEKSVGLGRAGRPRPIERPWVLGETQLPCVLRAVAPL